MKREPWLELLGEAADSLGTWESQWSALELAAPSADEREVIGRLAERLRDNYPFFHPAYAGQMLKPPHPIAWTAYALAMWINPNGHALDGGPATAHMERECVTALAEMVGFEEHLGHLSTSGTLANLEALWVARERTGGRAVAHSGAAHYTHARVCNVLGVESVPVPTDVRGRLDVDALDRVCDAHDIGTVVATLGTTGLGAIDPLDRILDVASRRGLRVHVDGAYGGFFALLARRSPPLVDSVPFDALARADSVVVDPHKHGLQPYGCGCVLFADPTVGEHYVHDSPYTYFTSSALHPGEITLECSRAGASAAALWATLQAIPLTPHEGLGDRLAGSRRAALRWATEIDADPNLRLVVSPDTDIICFAPVPPERAPRSSEVAAWADAVYEQGMTTGDDAFYLARYRAGRDLLDPLWPDMEWDTDETVLLRSVLMKPEHEAEVGRLHRMVSAAARAAIADGSR